MDELTRRLAEAYERFNRFEWDDLAGPKPDGFDDLPNYRKEHRLPKQRKTVFKEDYVKPAMEGIRRIIGDAAISEYRFTEVMGLSYEEWLQWYLSPGGPFGNQLRL